MFEFSDSRGFPIAESAGRAIGYFDPEEDYSSYDWIIVDSEDGKCYAAGCNHTYMIPVAYNYGDSAVKYVRFKDKWVLEDE